ncbi:MAG TPA: hypothetical protein VFT78_00490 [Hanamia sp.]|nr:hypothetical protein [Hanamia sp.]
MSTRKNEINHISIKGRLWIRIEPHIINFGWKGLPDKIHFTIAFNEDSQYQSTCF